MVVIVSLDYILIREGFLVGFLFGIFQFTMFIAGVSFALRYYIFGNENSSLNLRYLVPVRANFKGMFDDYFSIRNTRKQQKDIFLKIIF